MRQQRRPGQPHLKLRKVTAIRGEATERAQPSACEKHGHDFEANDYSAYVARKLHTFVRVCRRPECGEIELRTFTPDERAAALARWQSYPIHVPKERERRADTLTLALDRMDVPTDEEAAAYRGRGKGKRVTVAIPGVPSPC